MNRHPIDFYGDPCRTCGFDWSTTDGELVDEATMLEETYRSILGGLPGTARHPELGWCASAYVLHVADNLRLHGERMASIVRGEEFEFVGLNQDELAEVRRYEEIPIEGALWSLGSTVVAYLDIYRLASASGVVLPHLVRGRQLATHVLHGNIHDAHHHAWDLGRIATANGIGQ